MTVTAKAFFGAKQAEASQTTQYTANNVRAVIDKFTGTNTSAANATLTINLVTFGGTAGSANQISQKTLMPGEAYPFPEVVGHVLNSGDFISTLASDATAITIRSSGREIS